MRSIEYIAHFLDLFFVITIQVLLVYVKNDLTCVFRNYFDSATFSTVLELFLMMFQVLHLLFLVLHFIPFTFEMFFIVSGYKNVYCY